MRQWLDQAYQNPIVQNLLASLVWVCIVGGAIYVFGWRRYRRWWRISAAKGAVVRFVTGTWDNPRTPLGYTHAVTTVADSAALGYAVAGLTLAYGRKYPIRTYCSRWFHQTFWDDTVVLIGGRVRNDATRALLTSLESDWELPLKITDLHVPIRTIKDLTSGATYESTLRDDEIVKDYGVLCRLPNPFVGAGKKPVFLFYGLHTFGTIGAAKMIAPEYIGQLVKSFRFRRMQWCQVLVSVAVKDEEVYPTVELVKRVKRSP